MALPILTATGAKVYIAEAPYYDPDFTQYPAEYRRTFFAFLVAVAKSLPGVTLLPALEADCSMMTDTLHLNRKGGELFTEYLRRRVL